MGRLTRLGLAALAAVGAATPAALAAQTVQGTVRNAETGEPVEAAFVALLDAAGARVAATLSSPAGVFRLRASGAGPYRMRIQRIGFDDALGEPFTASGAAAIPPLMIELTPRAISLEGIAVEADRRCRVRPDRGATARLWDEVRKALDVADWAQGDGVLLYRLVLVERTLDAEGLRVLDERRAPRGGLGGGSPFVSLPPEELQSDGYIQPQPDGGFRYFAPDAAALLSDAFLDGHCFTVRLDDPPEHGWVGLAFEPVRRRPTPDIRGVLWVEAASAELRRLDFGYTWLPGELVSDRVGGRVEFARVPEGPWIVERWWLRMPVVSLERVTPPMGGVGEMRPRLLRIRETGGEVTSLRAADGSPLALGGTAGGASDTPVRGTTLTGLVWDSVAGRPLAGATVRLQGTAHESTAGADGRFRFASVPEGRYHLAFDAPGLDTLGWRSAPVTVALEAGAAVEVPLAVPALATLLAEHCGQPILERGTAVLTGTLRGEDGGAAPEGAEVVLSWETGAVAERQAIPGGRARAGRRGDALAAAVAVELGRTEVRLTLGTESSFVLCGLPAEEGMELRAEAPGGLVAGPVPVRIPEGALRYRGLVLRRR